jgi:hypothetical protein
MAHPDKTRGSSEKGQREHAGKTGEASDAGMQRRRQGIAGGDDTPASAGDEQGGTIFPEAHRDTQGAQAPKTARGGQKSHVGKR